MFQKILVPISSEFFHPAVYQISALIAQASKGSVSSVYVYEEKVFDEVERRSNAYVSRFDLKEAAQQVRREHLQTAEQVVFEAANAFFKKRGIPFETRLRDGVLVDIIKEEVATQHFDLIVMGFEKEYTFDTRLLSEIPIPLWIEAGRGNKSILAVCSNLAPNVKIPEASIRLASLLGWELHMVYIIDTEDAVAVDESGVRGEKQSLENLQKTADGFVAMMKEKGLEVSVVTGAFEKETLKAASRYQAGLIIIGREQKQKGLLGLPVKDSKKKVLQHCKCSLLFLN
jgi:nucleotide-binding universal stress UspA family protein